MGKTRDSPRISDGIALRLVKGALGVAIAATLVFASAATWQNQSFRASGAGWFTTALTLCVLIRLALSRWAIDRVWAPQTATAPGTDGNTDAFIELAKSTYKSRHKDLSTLQSLVGLLIDPSGYFDRISERITVKPTWYESQIALTFGAATPADCLVPVVVQRKKVLIDDLVVSIDGNDVATLSYLENQGAMLYAVQAIYSQFATRPDLLRAVEQVVASPSRQDTTRLVRDLRELNPSNEVPANGSLSPQRWRDVLVQLVEVYSSAYFILVLVPHESPARTHQITVKRRFGSVFVAWKGGPTPRRANSSELVKSVLGLHWREHVFSLQRASEAISYHLSVDAPEGMYIYRRKFTEWEVPSETAEGMPALPTRRALLPDQIDSWSTQHLHVYLRDRLPEQSATADQAPANRHLYLGLSLRERPPGLLEAGLFLSLYLTMTVWTVGAYHDKIFGTSPPPGTWPTVLFGIPTLLAGWLVARIGADALRKMSVVTLVMSLWLAADSGLAVFGAAFKSGHIQATDESVDVWFVHMDHPLWGILMAVTALHLAFNVVFVLGRAGRYLWTLTRAIA